MIVWGLKDGILSPTVLGCDVQVVVEMEGMDYHKRNIVGCIQFDARISTSMLWYSRENIWISVKVYHVYSTCKQADNFIFNIQTILTKKVFCNQWCTCMQDMNHIKQIHKGSGKNMQWYQGGKKSLQNSWDLVVVTIVDRLKNWVH